MLFSTEYIVYLWMLPVTIFIILPLLISAVWLTAFCIKELSAGRIPFVSQYLNSHYSAKDGLHPHPTHRNFPNDTLQAELQG